MKLLSLVYIINQFKFQKRVLAISFTGNAIISLILILGHYNDDYADDEDTFESQQVWTNLYIEHFTINKMYILGQKKA